MNRSEHKNVQRTNEKRAMAEFLLYSADMSHSMDLVHLFLTADSSSKPNV